MMKDEVINLKSNLSSHFQLLSDMSYIKADFSFEGSLSCSPKFELNYPRI